MLDSVLTRIVKFFHSKSLKKRAVEISKQHEDDAAGHVAARYTRGNVAIQQGRIDDKESDRVDDPTLH